MVFPVRVLVRGVVLRWWQRMGDRMCIRILLMQVGRLAMEGRPMIEDHGPTSPSYIFWPKRYCKTQKPSCSHHTEKYTEEECKPSKRCMPKFAPHSNPIKVKAPTKAPIKVKTPTKAPQKDKAPTKTLVPLLQDRGTSSQTS